MTAICFVCNLPILSHQVGLVWQGGNGWDDYMREQLEESTLKARLGGRRDSSAQITTISPPTETQETSPPPRHRRRSSLAQLTDILKDWGGSATRKRNKELVRRETLADLAKSLPWPRSDPRKRRESSVDSGVKSSSSSRSRQDSQYSAARADIYQMLNRTSRGASGTSPYNTGDARRSSAEAGRRGSGESGKSSRRDSITTNSPKHGRRFHHAHYHHRGRRDSRPEVAPYRTDDRRTSITGAELQPPAPATRIDCCTQALPPPTIITSSVTSPSTSPSISPPCHTPLVPEPPRDSPPSRPTSPQPQISAVVSAPPTAAATSVSVSTAATESGPGPTTASSPTHPLVTTRRDSTTQVS